jgi:hypothetical protein
VKRICRVAFTSKFSKNTIQLCAISGVHVVGCQPDPPHVKRICTVVFTSKFCKPDRIQPCAVYRVPHRRSGRYPPYVKRICRVVFRIEVFARNKIQLCAFSVSRSARSRAEPRPMWRRSAVCVFTSGGFAKNKNQLLLHFFGFTSGRCGRNPPYVKRICRVCFHNRSFSKK